MSLNSRMHPRNIYRQNPDYSELALLYPEFMKIAQLDLNGKVKLNFKDANSLRILTKCLLHKDFGLTVQIPHNRLVPTLPLRLNYILWIEDLLGFKNDGKEIKFGIDVGTGSCAIYPLLAAAKNKWHMLATENDQINFDTARKNIAENDLESLVTILKDDGDTLLVHCFKIEASWPKVDFCICNPPFYSHVDDIGKSRNPSRNPPRNAQTGCLQELVTEGGEIAFVSKLITESKILTSRIGIYSTMLGHKTSLKKLLQILKTNGVDNCTHTEFCQGRTTRWGLAWTFSDTIDLTSIGENSKSKTNWSISFTVPPLEDAQYKVIPIVNKILKLLDEINIDYKHIQRKENRVAVEITAKSNTWSKQRRKRRMMKMANGEVTKDTNSNNIEENKDSSRAAEHKELFLKSLITVFQECSSINIEMKYIEGPAGKDSIHQILQYIKNNWK